MREIEEAAMTEEVTDAATDPVAELRRQLAERELSVMRAIIANSDLLQKVADAEEKAEKFKLHVEKLEQQPSPAEAVAEITRLKKEWSQTQKAQQREHVERRAELVKVRSQLHEVQKQFEEESRARRMEAAHGSATIANLHRDLGDMRVQASQSREEQDAQRKTHWKFALAVAGGLSVVFAAVFFWPAGSKLQAKTVDVQAPAVQTASPAAAESRGKSFAPAASSPVSSLLAPSGPEFSRSLGRLNEALGGFPNRTPEDVLREVHLSSGKDAGVCSFQWNNGQPSLLFGGNQPNVTITSSLSQCAQAVETYRSKNTGAAAPRH